MRTIVVLGHDAPTSPEFSLDDLPGAGRLDVLCRCVTAGLLHSHGIREDTAVMLVLDETYTIRFDGGSVRRLNPDERSTGALVRTALEQREEAVGRMPVETSPGVTLRRGGLASVLEDCGEPVTLLHEAGTPAGDVPPPEEPVFVLSDHHDLQSEDEATLEAFDTRRVRLGPVALHADQAITVAHHWLDTDGFTEF